MISHEKLKSPLGNNKRSEFGLRTGTKDIRTSFYKGTFCAQTGTMVGTRPTDPAFCCITSFGNLFLN